MKKIMFASLALALMTGTASAAEPTVVPTTVGECLDANASAALIASDESQTGRYELTGPSCQDGSRAMAVVDCSDGSPGNVLDFWCGKELVQTCSFRCPGVQGMLDAVQDERLVALESDNNNPRVERLEERVTYLESDRFFLGGSYRHLQVPGSSTFNGGAGVVGFRHYFREDLYMELDGSVGGGIHTRMGEDNGSALATLGCSFGIRPIEWLSFSLGAEGFIAGNGTETLIAGMAGVIRASLQFEMVRFGGYFGVGMAHHSNRTTSITSNGQEMDEEDIDDLPAHTQANLVIGDESEAELDFAFTGGIMLVFELP